MHFLALLAPWRFKLETRNLELPMTSTLNTFAEHWWVYVFHATWQAALVAAVVLAVVYALPKLPAPWRYALLFVALAKFAIPPIVTLQLGLFYWAAPTITTPVPMNQGHATVFPPSALGGGAAAVALTTQEKSEARNPKPEIQNLKSETSHPTLPMGVGRGEGDPASQSEISYFKSVFSSLKSQVSSLTWKSWAMLAHALGSLAILAWVLRGLAQLVRLTGRAEKVALTPKDGHPRARLLERYIHLSKRLDLKDPPDLLITSDPVPPIAYFVLQPKVMIPHSLIEKLPPAELDAILAHELAHHRRNDPPANLLQLLLCAAWWFNPVIWLLNAALRRTREECCDDALLGAGLTAPEPYCKTLLDSANHLNQPQPLGSTLGALGFAERLHPLGHRMKRIMNPKLKHVPKLSPGALFAIAILCLVILPGVRSKAKLPNATIDVLPDAVQINVVDEMSNEPIEGVSIHVRCLSNRSTVTTNKLGKAEARYDARRDDLLHIRTMAAGYVPLSVDFRGLSDATPLKPYTLKLPRGTVIGGIVLDTQGNPLEGASVKLSSTISSDAAPQEPYYALGASVATFATGADGRWRCDFAPQELDFLSIEITHEQFTTIRLYGRPVTSMEVELRDKSARFVLQPGVAVNGLITDSNNNPIAEAEVMLGTHYLASNSLRVKTNEQGRFSFEKLAPGIKHIVVQKPGFAPHMDRIVISQSTPLLQYSLVPGRTVHFRVVDDRGDPLAGASIWAHEWRVPGSAPLNLLVQTDSEGNYIWQSSAPLDTFKVNVSKAGFERRDYEINSMENEHVVTLRQELRLAGAVVDDETGEPVSQFTVIPGNFWEKDYVRWWPGGGVIARDGRFTFPFSPIGQHGVAVKIVADGYADAVSRRFREESGPVQLNFRLKKAGVNEAALTGSVLARDGQPVEQAVVCVSTHRYRVHLTDAYPFSPNAVFPSTKTDRDGHFKLPITDEPFIIVCSHDLGYSEIPSGAYKAGMDITLQPWGRVEGVLKIGQGIGSNRKVVVFRDEAQNRNQPVVIHQYYPVTTDAQGRFTVEKIKPGDINVAHYVELGHGSAAYHRTQPFSIKADQTTHAEVGGGGRTVTGHVRMADDQTPISYTHGRHTLRTPAIVVPFAQALTRRLLGSNARDAESTDEKTWFFTFAVKDDGTFLIEDVPPGEYEIELRFTKPSVNYVDDETVARGKATVTILPLGDSERDTPLDLGVIEVRRVEAEEPLKTP